MSDEKSKLELGIDQKAAEQHRELILELLQQKAGELTLADLSQLTESKKYGEVASAITVQELFDAYVQKEGLEPVVEGAESSEPKTPRKRKGSKPASGDEKNLRDPAARAAYEESVSAVIEGNEGGDTEMSEILSTCGGTATQGRAAVKALVSRGLVVYTGMARATRYQWKAKASEAVLEKYEEARGAQEPKS